MSTCIRSLFFAAISTLVAAYGFFTFFMSQMQASELIDRGSYSTMTSRQCKVTDKPCIQRQSAISVLKTTGAWEEYLQHPFLMDEPFLLYTTDVMDFYAKKSVVLTGLGFKYGARVISDDVEAATRPFLRLQNPGALMIITATGGLIGWLLSSLALRIKRRFSPDNTDNQDTIIVPLVCLGLLMINFVIA
jgi:hypothetical protein